MFKNKNKTKRELVLLKGNRKIYAVLRTRENVLASYNFAPETELKDVFSWGKKQNAESCRILQLSELYELAVNWNDELEFEENIEALNYELSSLSGQKPEKIRPAVIFENTLDGCRQGLIASAFGLKNLNESFSRSSESKMAFKGIGSIQQVLLINHFSKAEFKDEVLLFFMDEGAFAAFVEHGKIVLRNMPFGLPDNNTNDKQWETRAERRLNTFKGRKIRLYLEEEAEGFRKRLETVISPEIINECLLRDILAELSGIIVSVEANSGKQLSLAGIPPRVKDPREAGTMICLILIGGTIVMLLFQFLKLKITENTLADTLKQKKDMQQTIKSHETQIEKTKEQLDKYMQLYSIIQSGRHIDPDFVKVINLLGRYRLKYTKINKIQEQNNGVVISGETYWQPDLSKFFAHFEKQLTTRGMSLMPEGLEKIDETRLAFKCRIGKR